MPQIPIIIPLVVIGLVVGSTIKSKSARISKRKLASTSLAAGLLNSVHAYLLYLFTPAQTFTSFTGVSTTLPAAALERLAATSETSELSFVVASFLTALLMVLLVFGVAMVYARARRGEDVEETEEATSEEEAALAASAKDSP